jgi:hypothetical protein
MPSEKQDYLRLCNEHEVPFADFEAQFCSRCLQRECGRSQHGKSSFEQRIMTWEERLFNDVPRMDSHDPRYESFQAKKFLSIDPGPPLEVGSSAWVDPRDLVEPSPKAQAAEVPVPELKPEVAQPVVEPPAEKPEPSPAPVPLAPPPLMNTSSRPGLMIGPAKPAAPAVDPWEPKVSAPTGTVVKPGARVRMGGPGSGV